jgi:SecDF, P1 head subdomain
MKIRWRAFNLFLLPVALSLAAGCGTTGPNHKTTPSDRDLKKEVSTLFLHLEVNPDGTGQEWQVPIPRDDPVFVNVSKTPFLDVGSLAHAAVVNETHGIFAIKLQFDRHGALLLENVTASNSGQRIAIFSQFGQDRWLAAPRITGRISNGVLSFTPDATRAEAERIVQGLNNVVAKLQKHNKF